jgi:hypothetical protein
MHVWVDTAGWPGSDMTVDHDHLVVTIFVISDGYFW